MGVEFHRIGLAISSGVSHSGIGRIVSYTPPSGGNPPAGTLISTMDDIEYTGGTSASYVTEETLDTVYVKNQTHDVYVRADGSGGTYLDEYDPITTEAYDVKYKTYGTGAGSQTYGNFIYISGNCTGGNNYPNGSREVGYYHDGIGELYSSPISFSYTSYGYAFFAEECNDENGSPYTTTYYSDNNGGYFT